MSLYAFTLLTAILGSFVLFKFLTFLFPRSSTNPKKIPPPGPPAMPIIGNLHMVGSLPHQTLGELAKKHGPIMSIKLGCIRTVIVSCPRAAELFLKTHDSVFASRPKIQAAEILAYGNKGLGMTAYGPYWRNVKKLCIVHLLSASKIELYGPVRTEELESTVELLKKAAEKEEVVNVSGTLAKIFENLLYKTVLGRAKDDGNELKIKRYVEEMTRLTLAFNLSDYFPFLTPFDLQGFTRKMKNLHKSMDRVLEDIIEEHEQGRDGKSKEHIDFVDVLLSLLDQPMNPQDENSEIIGRDHIKAILLEMVAAALESSTAATEWAFSEILKNPRVMQTLQGELESVVGKHRTVQESDIPRLAYLDMVVKESFRLHPATPLIPPRESMEDVEVDGFYVPKKTRVLVNAWALGRDPLVWSDNAGEFFPERFMNDNVDIQGHDFRLLPFGSGRRKCPGVHMALTNVRFVLAQLVHCFDWKLPDGMTCEELDMTEKMGAAVGRANGLFARPIYRLNC